MTERILTAIGLITCAYWACRLALGIWRAHQTIDDYERMLRP